MKQKLLRGAVVAVIVTFALGWLVTSTSARDTLVNYHPSTLEDLAAFSDADRTNIIYNVLSADELANLGREHLIRVASLPGLTPAQREFTLNAANKVDSEKLADAFARNRLLEKSVLEKYPNWSKMSPQDQSQAIKGIEADFPYLKNGSTDASCTEFGKTFSRSEYVKYFKLSNIGVGTALPRSSLRIFALSIIDNISMRTNAKQIINEVCSCNGMGIFEGCWPFDLCADYDCFVIFDRYDCGCWWESPFICFKRCLDGVISKD